jgi:hypothetical protein
MTHNYSELFDAHEAMMLRDMDAAITQCNLWEWLREYTPEEGKGFMFSHHPNLDKINAAMKYQGHSGSSYAWTMRQMEYIAKHGWTLFEFANKNAKTVVKLSPLHIAEAHRYVPGFEGQADAMKKFSEGKMTYAEMRSLCG